MSTPRKPRTPAKPRKPVAARPPDLRELLTGYDVHGNPISFDKASPLGAEITSAIDHLPEGFKNEPATAAIAPVRSVGAPIPGFSDAEFRKFKLDLNREIHTYELAKTKDGKCCYLITNQAGIQQVSAYMALKRAMPLHELQGAKYANQAIEYIEAGGGCFLLGADNKYHIILGGRRIPIDAESRGFQAFFRDACHITTLSPEARMAVQHLDILAHNQASRMVMRGFSAMYHSVGGWDNDGRVYLPVSEPGKILRITPAEISTVPNGNNRDELWLEHPKSAPFTWTTPVDLAEVRESLRMFEQLLVDPQACKVPEMAWLVGMAEGIFPIVRDVTENRFLTLHIGEKGHGKTFAAKQAMLLHGFDDVMFDPSIAALDNLHEQGMLVLDNKEQANFDIKVIDWLLRMATGGDRLRSDQNRDVHYSAPRPIVALTSIEGPPKEELKDRCLYVEYWLANDTPRLDEDAYHASIRNARDRIISAIALVVQDYLILRSNPEIRATLEAFRPIDRFNRHFHEVCYLLIAYARIMQRDEDHDYTMADDWAMNIIRVWDHEIRRARGAGAADATVPAESKVSPFEDPILHVIQQGKCESSRSEFEYPAKSGCIGDLYTVYTSALQGALTRERLPGLAIPVDPEGFGRRIRCETFERFHLLDQSDGVPRRSKGRTVGIWIPRDGTM